MSPLCPPLAAAAEGPWSRVGSSDGGGGGDMVPPLGTEADVEAEVVPGRDLVLRGPAPTVSLAVVGSGRIALTAFRVLCSGTSRGCRRFSGEPRPRGKWVTWLITWSGSLTQTRRYDETLIGGYRFFSGGDIDVLKLQNFKVNELPPRNQFAGSNQLW